MFIQTFIGFYTYMNFFFNWLANKRKKISSLELKKLEKEEFIELRNYKKKKIIKEYSNFLGTRRFARRVGRTLALRQRNGRDSRRIVSKEKLLARYRRSLMLDAFYSDREKEWLLLHKRKNRAPIKVKKFSFLDAPIQTIETLQEIALAESKYDDVVVDFHFEYCKDIGPFLVLGVMAKEMSPFLKGGDISPSTKKVLEAVELDQFLKMNFKNKEKLIDVWPFSLASRYPSNQQAVSLAGSSQKIEKVSQNFASTIDKWIGKAVKRDQKERVACLNEKGHTYVISLIGEILDNAQRHADLEKEEAGEWHIAGFMAKRYRENNRQHDYICHVSVLNLGDSIGKTISDNKTTDFILKFLKKYTSMHMNKYIDDGKAELLNTVAALQKGISRFAEEENMAGNGTGFVTMMEIIKYFENSDIPDLEPCVTIISGSSCITFNGKYGPNKVDESGKHFTWLNEENTYEKEPDEENAFMLPVKFPGTVLSFRFNINKNLIGEQEELK